MKFFDYINRHHVFTTSCLYAAMDSVAAAEEQLRLAVKSGVVERVRRGLLVSNHGRFEDVPVDQVEIVTALDPGAVISYHSALVTHGVAHNVGFVCYFRSDSVQTSFAFRGVDYRPCGPVGSVKTRTLRSSVGTYLTTTKEQTVIDCLDNLSRAGGAEEAVRSLSTFTYLDVVQLAERAIKSGRSMTSRVGWLLSEKATDWHVEESVLGRLEANLGSGPYRLQPARTDMHGWSSRWKLILPDRNEEVTSWITRM